MRHRAALKSWAARGERRGTARRPVDPGADGQTHRQPGRGGGAGRPSSRGGGAGTPLSPPGTPPAGSRLGCRAGSPPPGDSSDPAPRGKPGPRSPLALSFRLSSVVRVCVSRDLAARAPLTLNLISNPGSPCQARVQRGQATPWDLVSFVLYLSSSEASRSGFLPENRGRGEGKAP